MVTFNSSVIAWKGRCHLNAENCHQQWKPLHNPKLLATRDEHVAKLQRLFDGTSSECVYTLFGVLGTAAVDPYKEPEAWVEQCLDDLAAQADLIQDKCVFRPLAVEYGIYGVHFVDKLFGADVHQHPESGQWYSDYLEQPVGGLSYPDLAVDPTWQLAQRATNAFVRADVPLPFFGLPTIASVLNIAVNLYGQDVLEAMVSDPRSVVHDLAVIGHLLLDLHRWYLQTVPREQLQPVVSWQRTQPPGFGQICGCTTQLISAAMYERYAAPWDERVLAAYPNGGMIHLCGHHTQHLAVWRSMRSLRAVQLNDAAAEELAAYFHGLRSDQVIYLNPCAAMTVADAMKITGGQRLVIVDDVSKPPPVS